MMEKRAVQLFYLDTEFQLFFNDRDFILVHIDVYMMFLLCDSLISFHLYVRQSMFYYFSEHRNSNFFPSSILNSNKV